LSRDLPLAAIAPAKFKATPASLHALFSIALSLHASSLATVVF
jgi:hypothetical protein